MHYHKIISIRKIDFPSQPSNENIDFICRHYYNFIDKSQTERNDIIMEDPDNILAIIDLDLNNASNTPRTIYNMLKKKHPHQHILIWCLPHLTELLQQNQFKKFLLEDLYISLFAYRPQKIYLVHPEYIENNKILNVIHNSFKVENKYFQKYFAKYHYETHSYQSSASSSYTRTKIINYIDFELFNDYSKNFFCIFLHPQTFLQPTSTINISINRPVHTCARTIEILFGKAKHNINVFYPQTEIRNIHPNSQKKLVQKNIPIHFI